VKKLLRSFVLTLILTGSLATASYADGGGQPTCDPMDPNCKPPAVASATK
jgi:hypothetical protein